MFFRTKKRADDPQWQSEILERLALSAWREQRAARRWGIFFKLLFVIYFTYILFSFAPLFSFGIAPMEQHTAVVELKGVIADSATANAESVIAGLEAAFSNSKAKAVILSINSPGGSAVQSDEIFEAIRSLHKKHPKKKLYAVISDVGASGAYYVASAADQIYASESSLVGSIGVLYNGFGFVDALDKLGVERRVFTAGSHKDTLDPFRPLSTFDKSYIKSVLDDVHQTFITKVKEGRGDRLVKGRDEELFSGLAWTGRQAKELGLIDGFGSVRSVANDVIKTSKIIDYTESESLFDRIGISASTSLGQALQAALPWGVSSKSGFNLSY